LQKPYILRREFLVMGQKRLENGIADNYLWCSYCGRTYKLTEYKISKDKYGLPEIRMYHYQDCNGCELGYQWRWETIRARHKGYPLMPKKGKVYQDGLMNMKARYRDEHKYRKAIRPFQLKLKLI
jgi:hypothetical protein